MRNAVWALTAAACARVAVPGTADGGNATAPRIAELQPAPGAIESDARFHLVFSEPMDEGQLLASTGRSETELSAKINHQLGVRHAFMARAAATNNRESADAFNDGGLVDEMARGSWSVVSEGSMYRRFAPAWVAR